LHRAKPARSERRSASLKEWGRVKEMVGSGEHFRVVEACVRAGVVGVAGVRAGRGPPRRGLALRPASGDADWSSGPDGQRGARVRVGVGVSHRGLHDLRVAATGKANTAFSNTVLAEHNNASPRCTFAP
jgi:hypothetical protein